MIASEPVTLKGGFVVTLTAVQLLWKLEARGLNLEREGDQLAVSLRELLTDADRRASGTTATNCCDSSTTWRRYDPRLSWL